MKKYDYTQIPPSWQYCFHASCPMHDTCLRYQTGLHLPDDHLWGQAVFPPAMKNGHCDFYRKDEKVTLATGFVTDDEVQNKMFISMRLVLSEFLGGNGGYYLYRNGKRWLSPAQQEHIRQLFRKAGYQGEVHFEKTTTDYYWL
jgi:hypothetical protein